MPKRKQTPRSPTPPFRTAEELDARLANPSQAVVDLMARLDGDILILGVNGKMGPTLARMAGRAVRASGRPRRVFGVSRSLAPETSAPLEAYGVTPVRADLLEPGALESLPDVPNVLYLCGRKFGSTGAEWDTWGTNVLLAGLTARRYRDARIVAFSSGNVYPLVPVSSGGATEQTPPTPVGEYAMSCLGRERMFDYHARHFGTRVLHFRLNYAAELRYGVIRDVADKVWDGHPVDVTMGNVNCVWQGYACAVALLCFELAESPPRILNVTGPETVSIRRVAERMAALMGFTPVIEGTESPTALLSNASECHRLFGYPDVPLDTLVEWVARWVAAGGSSLGKPTHFETRDGRF